ncbi:MAG: cysteine methyltransferase, partial [Pseudoflavonifractor sp.]
MDFLLFSTPLGRMGLAAEDGAITRLYLPGAPTPRIACHETPLLLAGRGQLLEYCGGGRTVFTLPLRP